MNETLSPTRSTTTTARESELARLRAKLIEMIAEREAQRRTEPEHPEHE